MNEAANGATQTIGAEGQARLEQLEYEYSDLREQLRQMSTQLLKSEERNSLLGSMLVGGIRLFEDLRRDKIVTVIEEVVANLLGSEEFVIVAVGSDGPRRIGGMGVYQGIGDDDFDDRETILSAVSNGHSSYASASVLELSDLDFDVAGHPAIACVPFTAAGRAVGAVAIYRLLPQKIDLEPSDRELLALLGTQAGMALHLAERVAAEGA